MQFTQLRRYVIVHFSYSFWPVASLARVYKFPLWCCSQISYNIPRASPIEHYSTFNSRFVRSHNLTMGCLKNCIGRLQFKPSSQHPTVIFQGPMWLSNVMQGATPIATKMTLYMIYIRFNAQSIIRPVDIIIINFTWNYCHKAESKELSTWF